MRRTAALAALAALGACGGGGGGGTPAPPTTANRAPVFTSPTTESVVENRIQAYQATASDADGNPLTFSIAGGVDAVRFTISGTGALSFVAAPDFELPADSDKDNVYHVQLRVSDGAAVATLPVQITVTNDPEGIAVRRIATGFNKPVHIAAIPGDNRLLVGEKGGIIRILDPATGAHTPFLSVTQGFDSIRGSFPDFSMDGDRGLLGFAPAPNYASSRDLVVAVTVADGDIEVRKYDIRGIYDLDSRGARSFLRIEHSQSNVNYGGWVGFGPSGSLFITTGDGGDPQAAQDPYSLLGKILRLTSALDPFAGAAPLAPWFAHGNNPYAKGGGAREVFALGLRNPLRASFSGDSMLIGDVGEAIAHEIDLLPTSGPGLNFGWPFRQGTAPFSGTAPAGLTGPVTEYAHGSGPREGRAVTGGLVYRGAATTLRGRYVFGDRLTGNLWSVPADKLVPGQVLPSSSYELRNADFRPDAGTIDRPVAFGEDATGNFYIVDEDGEVFLVGGA